MMIMLEFCETTIWFTVNKISTEYWQKKNKNQLSCAWKYEYSRYVRFKSNDTKTKQIYCTLNGM